MLSAIKSNWPVVHDVLPLSGIPCFEKKAIEFIVKLCANCSCSLFVEECSCCLEWEAGKDWPCCQ